MPSIENPRTEYVGLSGILAHHAYVANRLPAALIVQHVLCHSSVVGLREQIDAEYGAMDSTPRCPTHGVDAAPRRPPGPFLPVPDLPATAASSMA